MAPVDLRLPPKPPAVPFPEVSFADLHRGIGIPIPAGYRPPTPPTSSPPHLPTSAPRGSHQTSVSPPYPTPPDESERLRRLDQLRGRRKKREAERRAALAAKERPVPRRFRRIPVSESRRQAGSTPSRVPSRRGTSSSDAAEEGRQVHGYFHECLDAGDTVLTSEEQDFLVEYLGDGSDGERELVRRLVRKLEWSGCEAALIYKLAAWVHAHVGCDRTLVRLLTHRLGRPDALDKMRTIGLEDELVLCRKIVAISENRLAKKSHNDLSFGLRPRVLIDPSELVSSLGVRLSHDGWEKKAGSPPDLLVLLQRENGGILVGRPVTVRDNSCRPGEIWS
ncbi:hypothetical protein ABKA04_000624 [Annulohypoxylon sp. FPYF3050]